MVATLQSLRPRGLRGAQLFFVNTSRFLSHADSSSANLVFHPKRILLLSKITRYDFERQLLGASDDEKIRSAVSGLRVSIPATNDRMYFRFQLKRKGLNVDALLTRHHGHHQRVAEFQKQLR
ncbi:unnamed protein product [Echinostoma caproni]|uniref:Uncharacterized protein n=1 Tax=Echinostoma caproni TaxID=27848 RepID=A0A183AYV1_9TREM|nr:unnamed protein product [Echinostoma caproni]